MEKTYDTQDFDLNRVEEMNVSYLIDTSRRGIPYQSFLSMADAIDFSLNDWSAILHLSERTMQRYKKEQKSFDTVQSEKILEISLLIKRGIEVFGTMEKFNIWLNSVSVALGSIKPKELLDNSFGIDLLKDELGRIEHGILA